MQIPAQTGGQIGACVGNGLHRNGGVLVDEVTGGVRLMVEEMAKAISAAQHEPLRYTVDISRARVTSIADTARPKKKGKKEKYLSKHFEERGKCYIYWEQCKL